MEHEALFSKYDLHAVIAQNEDKLRMDIDAIEQNRILNTPVEEWCDYFEAELGLHPPVLAEDQIQADQEEIDVDVSHDPRRLIRRPGPVYVKATVFKFYVPFTGDAEMFQCRPSTFTLNPPTAAIFGDELVFSYRRTEHGPGSVKTEFESDLASVKNYLLTMQKDVASYNASIRLNAKARIEERRHKLLANEQALNALGFPLRRREGAPKTYLAPEVKRKAPMSPAAKSPSSRSEPTLDLANYDHILTVCSNMVHVIERSPHAFREMGEEDLRQHFLVQLNGQYEGQATGETFNYEGKTDILIRSGGRNVFIAECKFWKGAGSLSKAITQLLSYAAWRDTKLALIVFNKNKEFTSVLTQIPDLLKGHANFIRMEPYKSETGFRCVMHHNDDKQRELTVTVLAFDVPS